MPEFAVTSVNVIASGAAGGGATSFGFCRHPAMARRARTAGRRRAGAQVICFSMVVFSLRESGGVREWESGRDPELSIAYCQLTVDNSCRAPSLPLLHSSPM